MFSFLIKSNTAVLSDGEVEALDPIAAVFEKGLGPVALLHAEDDDLVMPDSGDHFSFRFRRERDPEGGSKDERGCHGAVHALMRIA